MSTAQHLPTFQDHLYDVLVAVVFGCDLRIFVKNKDIQGLLLSPSTRGTRIISKALFGIFPSEKNKIIFNKCQVVISK